MNALTSPAKRQPESPLLAERWVLLSIVGFWLLYFVLNTIGAALASFEGQLDMLPRRFCVTLAAMLLVYLLYRLLRALEGRSMSLLLCSAFAGAVPVALTYAAINYAAFYLIIPLDWVKKESLTTPMVTESPAHVILQQAMSWYFFVLAWAALYLAMSYAARVAFAERSAALYRAEAQQAQLRALRYQINPHFLFNTLNSLSTLIMCQRNDDAERMLLNLAGFFRSSLTGDPAEDVTLADEIQMQILYLDIEKNRFPDRLLVRIDVPKALDSAMMPGFLLQPLVENAIKYGVSRSTRPVTVTISARAEGDTLILTVEDDGALVGGTVEGGTGVGLCNVEQRLAARFGERASCVVGREPFFRVELTMPLLLTRILVPS